MNIPAELYKSQCIIKTDSYQTCIVPTRILNRHQISKLDINNNTKLRLNFSPDSYKKFVTEKYNISNHPDQTEIDAETNDKNNFFKVTPIWQQQIDYITTFLSHLAKGQIKIFTDRSLIKSKTKPNNYKIGIGILIDETSSSAAIEILGQYKDIPSIQTAELAAATYAISILSKQSHAEIFIDSEQTI